MRGNARIGVAADPPAQPWEDLPPLGLHSQLKQALRIDMRFPVGGNRRGFSDNIEEALRHKRRNISAVLNVQAHKQPLQYIQRILHCAIQDERGGGSVWSS